MHRQLFILAVLLAAPATASAEMDVELSAAVAGEVHVAPQASGNGIVLVQADLGRYRVRLNTDTLDLSAEFSIGPAGSVRVGVAGEAFVAGLLTNYYQAGERVPERGFPASWGGAYLELQRKLGDDVFLQWRPMVRRWGFGRGSADDALELPPEFTSVENKVGITLWGFRPDRSQWEPHRLFRRLRGFGAGFEGEFWWRSEASRWGVPSDPRNEAERSSFAGTGWSAFGVGSDRVRLQSEQRVRAGFGEDDITRARIGGFNPYTVRLGGVGWPAFLSSHYASINSSLHFALFGESEGGVAVDGVALSDPSRTGESEFGTFGAVSLFADVRSGPWQFDARFGWTLPSDYVARGPQLGAFVALGRGF